MRSRSDAQIELVREGATSRTPVLWVVPAPAGSTPAVWDHRATGNRLRSAADFRIRMLRRINGLPRLFRWTGSYTLEATPPGTTVDKPVLAGGGGGAVSDEQQARPAIPMQQNLSNLGQTFGLGGSPTQTQCTCWERRMSAARSGFAVSEWLGAQSPASVCPNRLHCTGTRGAE